MYLKMIQPLLQVMEQVISFATLAGTKEGVDPIYFTSHMDTVIPAKGVKPSLKMAML